MNKKRFIKGYHTIRDTNENKTYDFQVNIICDLLNNLVEDNEQLKEKNQNLRKCINEIYLISSRESVE